MICRGFSEWELYPSLYTYTLMKWIPHYYKVEFRGPPVIRNERGWNDLRFTEYHMTFTIFRLFSIVNDWNLFIIIAELNTTKLNIFPSRALWHLRSDPSSFFLKIINKNIKNFNGQFLFKGEFLWDPILCKCSKNLHHYVQILPSHRGNPSMAYPELRSCVKSKFWGWTNEWIIVKGVGGGGRGSQT